MVELLPYLWEWEGMSMLFRNLTNSLGDVHHFAWRARRPRHVLYAAEKDTRFAEWNAEECQTVYALLPPQLHIACLLTMPGCLLRLLHPSMIGPKS